MKILAISTYYKPIRPGYGTRTPEIIIDSAARLGHDVTVYTGIVPKDMISDEKHSKRKHIEKIGDGSVEINRIWIPTSGHNKPLSRTLIYLMFVFSCFFKMLFNKNHDVVLGLFPFPPFLILLEILAKIKRKKFYMHQGDLFPETVIDFHIIKNKFAIDFLRKISIWSFNLADIIGVNNLATKVGMKRYPIDQNKVKYLELAIDTELFYPIKKPTNTNFTVLYNGVFGPAYDFDLMLNAAKKMEGKDIEFIIAGKGELEQYIRNGIKKRNLTNVKVLGPVKEIKDLVKRLNYCDIAILCLVPSEVSKTPHPSKIFEYMACGKPVICVGAGAVEEIFKRSGGGLLVPPKDIDGFTKSILKFYDNRKLCEEIGIKARSYIEANHSMEVYMRNFEVIINSLR